MAFELPPLPYPKNALEPHISERTMDFHHGKHHQAYVTNLNNLVKGSPMEKQSLEELIKATYKDSSKTGVFNNAAQVWNHTFFWNSMKPNGGGSPTGDIAQAITRDCGGLDKFKEQFKAAAVGQFGSGWAWLVPQGGQLKITPRRTRSTRWPRVKRRSSPATFGSTPITSITRTAGRISSRPSSTIW